MHVLIFRLVNSIFVRANIRVGGQTAIDQLKINYMSETKQKTLVLGLMSGTSLDGLDLALCEFSETGSGTAFRILKSLTLSYTKDWSNRLSQAHLLSAEAYFSLHGAYGRFLGESVRQFLKDAPTPICIGSHGHTIFHQPALGFSTQLGCGATLAAVSGIDTVNDFRSGDVALGGQGAPLVPCGDALLFGHYEACLNIGGIANISFGSLDQRQAFDISPANMLLNFLAGKKNQPYDAGGESARRGQILPHLLKTLNDLPFYQVQGARSLQREWFEQTVLPLLPAASADDLLATCTEHIAEQVAAVARTSNIKEVLITGGGAYNTFLLERMKAKADINWIVPDDELIQFKEALIFAFLAYRRARGEVNALASVTGALRDSCTGAWHKA